MIGFVKSSTMIAILLMSATFAYAGDLKAVPAGGNNMHPAPGHGQATALNNVSNTKALDAIGEVGKEEKDKIRKLRPVK